MELNDLSCTGCGSHDVDFLAAERKIICNQCGKQAHYSRATIGKNKNVILAKDNAITFFINGDLDSARHYALDVLNVFIDNAPALYIVSYYDEVKNARNSSVQNFFASLIERDADPLEYDEIRELQSLILASAPTLIDYEKQIIYISTSNMQAEEDARELAAFIDALCPYFIQRRSSIDFLDEQMASYYQELAAHLDIPKTCLALIKAIRQNPGSPYKHDTFSLRAKTTYFYEHFVLVIGSIVRGMKNSPYKTKLCLAYEQELQKFKQQMSKS